MADRAVADHAPIWHACYTHPKAEAMVHRHLVAQGYETLYLHYRATTRHARRERAVLLPYFRRYVFVGIRPGQSLYQVNHGLGVSGVVSTTDGPLEIPSDVIDEQRSRGVACACPIKHGKCLAPELGSDARPRYREGDEVWIKSGAPGGFEDFVATVALDTGTKLTLWVSMFGRVVKTVVEPDQVSPVSPERAERCAVR